MRVYKFMNVTANRRGLTRIPQVTGTLIPGKSWRTDFPLVFLQRFVTLHFAHLDDGASGMKLQPTRKHTSNIVYGCTPDMRLNIELREPLPPPKLGVSMQTQGYEKNSKPLRLEKKADLLVCLVMSSCNLSYSPLSRRKSNNIQYDGVGR